jgi:hypothetical protein
VARIVGDHSMSRLATSCSFQRSMTRLGARGGIGDLPFGIDGNVEARVRTDGEAQRLGARPDYPGWEGETGESGEGAR